MITADNISIQSRLAIQGLADMQMEIKAGSHGRLVLRGYLADGLRVGTLIGEERSRSFQDTGMTYAQIIGRVLAGYGGSAPCEKVSLKTGIPVIQYEETDWQFLKRMAGSAGQAVVCDETAAEPYFKLGLTVTGKKAIFPEGSYRCMVDESYYYMEKGQGLPRTEFLYYQAESTDNHAIGDHAWYKGRTYYIYEKQAEWEGGCTDLPL